jgi:hypothetical protein
VLGCWIDFIGNGRVEGIILVLGLVVVFFLGVMLVGVGGNILTLGWYVLACYFQIQMFVLYH